MYTKQNKKIIEAMELLNEVNNELKTIEKEKGIKSPYRLTMGHLFLRAIDSAFDSVLGEIYKTRSN